MKKIILFLSLLTLAALPLTTKAANVGDYSSALFGNFLQTGQVAPFTTATIKIRRVRDNRIIASSAGGTFNYPNDRVARGEEYKIEVSYNTNDPCLVTGFVNIFVDNNSSQSLYYISPDCNRPLSGTIEFEKRRVSNDPNFKNVYFQLYIYFVDTRVKLPIGSY